MADVAILIPSLGRSERLRSLVANIVETTPPVHRIVFVLDPEDEYSWDAVTTLISDNPSIRALECDGTYPEKINAAVKATTQPWMLLTADDVRFHAGWWEAAIDKAKKGVGVIGTNDLHNPAVQRGEYATQMLVARWYAEKGTIDEPGKVFCEGYHHNCIDIELCETAQARGAYAHAHDSVIEHRHFTFGFAERDATYEKGCLTDTDADEDLLRRRRELWRGSTG